MRVETREPGQWTETPEPSPAAGPADESRGTKPHAAKSLGLSQTRAATREPGQWTETPEPSPAAGPPDESPGTRPPDESPGTKPHAAKSLGPSQTRVQT